MVLGARINSNVSITPSMNRNLTLWPSLPRLINFLQLTKHVSLFKLNLEMILAVKSGSLRKMGISLRFLKSLHW